ncbi:MAG: SRPBCC domain-containing protein [Hydrotalea sp.]|nr:SRPBCC domain-containing protein [Hydrotalea sp.]
MTEKEIEITVESDMPAERGAIWRALVEPDQLKKWWAPEGFEIKNIVVDLKVGGERKFDMVQPDGNVVSHLAIYREIIPEKKLVFDSGSPGAMVARVAVELAEASDGTHVALSYFFPPSSQPDREKFLGFMRAGGERLLKNLKDYLQKKG